MSFPRAPWWMYVIAASLLGNFALSIYSYFRGPEPPFNRYTFSRDALVVEEVLPNSAADRAGIQALDRVLAIDGTHLRGLGQWDALRINFEVGKPYHLELERDGKRFDRVMTLQAWSWSHQPQYRSVGVILNVASALLTLFVAFLVAFSRPHDWVARIGALSIALMGGLANHYGTSAIVRHLPVFIALPIWWPQIGEFIFAPLFFAFCSIFPRQLFRSRWAWLANVPSLYFMWPILGFAYFTFAKSLGESKGFAKLSDESLGSDWGPRLGVSLLMAYIGAGLVVLILNYRRLDDLNEKRRIRVLVTGSLVGYLVIVPSVVFSTMRLSAQSDAGRILLSWPAQLLTTVVYQAFPLSWAYVILRHRLFDVRVILRQGLQYALARRVLLAVVPGLGFLLLADLLFHGQQPLLEILRARGWIYVVLGGLTAVAYLKRQNWLEALDRRFFRDRYNAQGLLREVVEEVRQAHSFEHVGPRVVARIETALHPNFVDLLIRGPHESAYHSLAAAPLGHALVSLPAESKLMSLIRLLGKPLEVPQTSSGWLKEQLPPEESAFLREARIELLVPVVTGADRMEAVLALGSKRSEEPYAREDLDLLIAIASSLALLLEKSSATRATRSDVFEECPQCGVCYDAGSTHCPRESARLVPVVLPRLLSGRYHLERRLGRGGMGTVYVASDRALERRVAVKVIREDLVGSADAAERFRQEARVAASFAHPNVVTVHDFGVAAGTRAYLVMELLEGVTLRDGLSRQQRLPAANAIPVLRDVCTALEAAHRRQLIHRDLKPENIFLIAGESGEAAKILDFGLAKFRSNSIQQQTVDTAPGAVLGTLRYMSPEQRRGLDPHPSWDLWALAVVAYEILTGVYPFSDGSPGDCFGPSCVAGFTPIATNLPEAPPSWQEFFNRAFAFETALRPQSAETFFSEFERTTS